MDEPRRGWMDSLLRNALINVGDELRRAALRTVTAVAAGIALGLVLAIAAVAMVVIGMQHLAVGLNGLVRMLIGETWACDLISGAVLLAIPVICALIIAYRQPGKPPTS